MAKIQNDGVNMVHQASSMKRMDAYNQQNVRFETQRLAKIRRKSRNRAIVTTMTVSCVLFCALILAFYPIKTATVAVMPSIRGIISDANSNRPAWLKDASIAIEPGLDPLPDYIGESQGLELYYSQTGLGILLNQGSWSYRIR